MIGDKKELGEPVGRVGNTGTASTGPHLHLTVSRTAKGVFGVTSAKLDPKTIIQQNAERPTPKQTPKKTEAVVQPAKPIVTPELTIVYACPHCKKELK
jgi:murein DD-endopeptidase MepM/ murein hydrolase activator NlpD